MILILLAIFALSYGMRQIDGPWGILASTRNYLLQNRYVGVFFLKLFTCPFCMGFWSGIIAALLSEEFRWNYLLLWGFAGSGLSFLSDLILDKLAKPE